ncbi:hypothetical protein GEMRC1_001629 [Eukaryota sp. GEM-RC1]
MATLIGGIFTLDHIQLLYLLFVDKVIFYLHPAVPNPIRVISQPPFQITDTGWGEYETTIAIYCFGLSEPILCRHYLKLGPYDIEESLKMPSKTTTIEQLDFILLKDASPVLKKAAELALAKRKLTAITLVFPIHTNHSILMTFLPK